MLPADKSLARRYFSASVFAGAAATHAPFLSAPPFGSHFIFAFVQSALFVGGVCANAAGAKTSALTTATTERTFMEVSFTCLARTRCGSLSSSQQNADTP